MFVFLRTDRRHTYIMSNNLSKLFSELSVHLQTSTISFDREEDRLKSFEEWNIPFLDKNLLARTGFYYYGKKDHVRCNFCHVILCCWERHDDVVQEHLRWSPHCKLITGRKTNNVPINLRDFKRCLPEIDYDTCGTGHFCRTRPPYEARNVRINSIVETSATIPELSRDTLSKYELVSYSKHR